MRKSLYVLLTTLALVLAFAATANAAPKGAYKVTLRTSTTSSVAGRFITVAGRVTGPKAAGKSVRIQRQYGPGIWTTVATATVKHNGTYSARVETPIGGNTSFRALKAKSTARKAGISPTRTTKVFQWLYLSNEPGRLSGTFPYETTIGGKLYTHAFVLEDAGDRVDYRTDSLCTTFTTVVAYGTPSDPAASMNLNVQRTSPTQTTTDTVVPVSTAAPKTVTTSLVGTKVFDMYVDTTDPSFYGAQLGDPKIYCNASSLPELAGNDII
jgi:hypothetical protein